MHPTTIHELARQRNAQYLQEAEQHRLAMQATGGEERAKPDLAGSVRGLLSMLSRPRRTTGASPA